MNEKIREIHAQSITRRRKSADGETWVEYLDFDPEKFAELIIRECARIGSQSMYPDSDPDYVGCKIRTHFGVDYSPACIHQWNRDGERCIKCGDKDWMASEDSDTTAKAAWS